MITSVQALLIAFMIFAISRVFLRFREKTISAGVFLFWSLVWIVAALVVVSPPITTKFASYFGIGRGTDFVVYVSIALLFYLVFRIYVMIEDIRHEITDLVRHVALQKAPPRSKSKKRR